MTPFSSRLPLCLQIMMQRRGNRVTFWSQEGHLTTQAAQRSLDEVTMTSWDLASQKEARSWEKTLRVETGRSLLFSHRANEAGESRCQGKQTHLQLPHSSRRYPELCSSGPQGRERRAGLGWGPSLLTRVSQTLSCVTSQDCLATLQQGCLPGCLGKN